MFQEIGKLHIMNKGTPFTTANIITKNTYGNVLVHWINNLTPATNYDFYVRKVYATVLRLTTAIGLSNNITLLTPVTHV